MRTDLDHLPASKRRELERVVEILFEEFGDANGQATGKRRQGRILKIILFGSYARGGWVDELHTAKGYQSDYDLLVIVNQPELTDRATYWHKADERFIREMTITHALRTPVNFIVHTLQEVNDALAHGRFFFIDIARDGIALYQADDKPLLAPKPKTAADALAMATEYFEEWFPSAAGFLDTARYTQGQGRLKESVFDLHQATERQAAVPKLAHFMRAAGLTDFVLVESRSSSPELLDNGFLYFAQQELALDTYMALVERNLTLDQLEEFNETLNGLPELEDRVAEASDAVWAHRSGAPYSGIGADHAEIAHPEKARAWFDPDKQVSTKVHRFGRFDDERLTDAMIVAEIIGDGGESDFRLRFTARTDSPPRLKALREKVENVFFFNPDWQGGVAQLISYATRKTGVATIDIIAFSNEDVLRAIAGSAFGYPGYVPTFRLDIIHDGKTERFIGLIEWDGTTPDFDAVLTEHFGQDRFAYFIATHFGENRGMNLDIMNSLGLRYSMFRESDDGPKRIRVQGSTISVIAKPIRGSINTLIHENVDAVHVIVGLFMEHDSGFAQSIENFLNTDLPNAERRLAELIEGETRPAEVMLWSGDIKNCDSCEHSFAPLRFMVDAVLPGGIGANVCARCFFEIGRGLGEGLGQAYEAHDEGWLHVAG